MHGYKFWNTIIFYLSTELTRNFCVLTMFLHLGIQFFNLAQDIFRICHTLRRQAFDNKDGPNKKRKKISGIFQQIEDSTGPTCRVALFCRRGPVKKWSFDLRRMSYTRLLKRWRMASGQDLSSGLQVNGWSQDQKRILVLVATSWDAEGHMPFLLLARKKIKYAIVTSLYFGKDSLSLLMLL